MGEGNTGDQGAIPKALITIEDFITEGERDELVEWARVCRPKLNPNGFGRWYRSLNFLPRNQTAQTIRDRIVKKFSLENYETEKSLNDYLSIVQRFGQIHIHSDVIYGFLKEHHRFNVLVQLPFEGGLNIYDGETLKVEEGMLLAYRPDLCDHGATQVRGDRDRINLSFGFEI